LPHLFDIWRAAAPSIDFLAPDIYFQDFVGWARRYKRPGNPLFVPETLRSPDAAVNGLYAFGALDAIGFSPFGIESIAEPAASDAARGPHPVASGRARQDDRPALRGSGAETAAAGGARRLCPQRHVREGRACGAGRWRDRADRSTASARPSGGLVLATAPDEFIVAGTGITVTFATAERGKLAGILSAEEGRLVEGRWENIRWLGGDETHQGRHIRLEPGRFSIQRVRLYPY
jgi:hypothetical protein